MAGWILAAALLLPVSSGLTAALPVPAGHAQRDGDEEDDTPRDILRDVERYVHHWPKRHYEIERIDFMSADPHSDRLFVSYTIDFEVARGTRSVRGKASYGAVIKDIAGEPKVESIKEKVQTRSSGSNE